MQLTALIIIILEDNNIYNTNNYNAATFIAIINLAAVF